MELIGKIQKVMPLKSGVGKSGNSWRKREFVVVVPQGQYIKSYFFTAFNERADQVPAEGAQVKVEYDVRCTEWNERWFTELSVISVSEVTAVQQTEFVSYGPTFTPQQGAAMMYGAKAEDPDAQTAKPAPVVPANDDLPF